ncbi:MAG: PIG-L family deacetylase [Bacteroidetes bacterium]|nr:PIG-L family deacetylase [Bacteroidota bacterium]
MRKQSLFFTLFSFFLFMSLSGQAPEKWNSARIYHEIQKLNFLGSVLYLAAHPDDENTRLITYLANHEKANTAYISLTRGDGGQNLISPEIRELLGLIRTQELLGARQIDGGKQFFSRANDFGFSKNPDETFRIWEKEKVMEDLIAVIRYWQPDIIINRFDHRSPGKTHGHHTASAMLGVEAFDMAADPKVFPNQLSRLPLWQPKRLFFNTSWWFYGSQKAFDEADKSKLVQFEVGVYYPLLGKSNNEIAAESRSMHKSQGFGSLGVRGSETEYLELLKGDLPENNKLFSGINTTWSRVKGAEKVGMLLKKVENNFSMEKPYTVIPDLLAAMKELEKLEDSYWKREKLRDLKLIIKQSLGLFQEAVASESTATPGEMIKVQMEYIQRSPVKVVLQSLQVLPSIGDTVLNMEMSNNKVFKLAKQIQIPRNIPLTSPYWLTDQWNLGVYTVKDEKLRGLPETPKSLKVRANYLIDGFTFSLESEIVYKTDDPVGGEIYQPFEIIPAITGSFQESVNVFASRDSQRLEIVVKANKSSLTGSVTLEVPQGWTFSPKEQTVQFNRKGEEKVIAFWVTPPTFQSEGNATVIMKAEGERYDKKLLIIKHPHIPAQTVLLSSNAKVVRIDLEKSGEKVGYVMGAGDVVPASLSQMGFQVTQLHVNNLTEENLKSFDAVVLGVRAYNTVEGIEFKQKALFNYVENGGNLIVQYNTTGDLKVSEKELAPLPMSLSRDRITDEDAPVTFLVPNHSILNFPNKITEIDFKGWEQERGLYFPGKWDNAFTPVLRFNDPGEKPLDGALLVARHGKGYYIYTGLSFFRELPAGVPGAFRLFANMISMGKEIKP